MSLYPGGVRCSLWQVPSAKFTNYAFPTRDMYVKYKMRGGAGIAPGRLEDVNVYDAMAELHASKYQ